MDPLQKLEMKQLRFRTLKIKKKKKKGQDFHKLIAVSFNYRWIEVIEFMMSQSKWHETYGVSTQEEGSQIQIVLRRN